MTSPFSPLTDEEVQELDEFLLYGVDDDKSMTIDTLDGYLHAIAIGPTTLAPSVWMPPIWGSGTSMMPAAESIEQLNRILELVMRLYNNIIANLEDSPPEIFPHWEVVSHGDHEYDDAEGWAYGFCQGIRLCEHEWASLLGSPEGQSWYRPIALLGEDEHCPEQDTLTRTPEMRGKVALQIPDAVVAMYQHWLPLRRAVYEREVANAMGSKVGRNDVCPCGSGKKFKKCCGFANNLH